VPLPSMVDLLRMHPEVVQVSIKRQAWSEREKLAGGIIEADPEHFTQRMSRSIVWTEHRRYFTTNPSLYRTELCRRGWPGERFSEGIFSHRLLRERVSFAIWGAKNDPPRCEHLGGERRGRWY
jgi:hypothetical protein